MCVLGSVTTPQGLNNTDDLTPLLESSPDEWQVNEVGHQGISCYEDVCTGN